MDGFGAIQDMPEPKSSPSRHLNTSAFSERTQDGMSSVERKQYNKALKAMYEIVRLGAKRLDISDASHKEIIPETTESSDEMSDTVNTGPSYSSRSKSRQPKSRKTLSFNELYDQLPSGKSVKTVYAELMHINKQLQRENVALQERECRLRERERNLREAEKLGQTTDLVIEQLVDKEVEQRCRELTQSYEDQIFVLEEELNKRAVELRRVQDSFKTIKTANDGLKKQLTELQQQNRVLEAQAISVQHRLANLQRKNEFAARQVKPEKSPVHQEKAKPMVKSEPVKSVSFTINKINLSGTLDVLAVLLEWIAEAHLRKPPTFQETMEGSLQEQSLDFGSALVHEKCLKILPAMADILTYIPAVNVRVQDPCLQFTYWCILWMEKSISGSQRTTLASTFRHIGENLFKPQAIRFTDDGLVTGPSKLERSKCELYFHSPNLSVRLLSSLVILKTLTQVDYVKHVFDVLKNDLRDDVGKQLFLTFEGMNVILPFMKPSQKALLSSTIDVMLQMSMDSPFLQAFLESCCNEPWFRACVTLLQFKGSDEKIVEKLSIVLQRLSKSKSNRRYFEAFQIQPIVQELLRNCDPMNAFLALNLRSILYNLGSGKT